MAAPSLSRSFRPFGALLLALLASLGCFGQPPADPPGAARDFEVVEGAKTWRLHVPAGLRNIRGLLIVGNYSGGDSRDYHQYAAYGTFLQLHGFAYLGDQGDAPHSQTYDSMRRALPRLAANSGHPELLNAPWATTGFSSGGGYASYLLLMAPDKLLGAVLTGSRLKLPARPPVACLGVPVLNIGEHIDQPELAIDPPMVAFRPFGALWGGLWTQGHGHEMCGQETLSLPYLDAVTRLRYPADGDPRQGPVRLLPIPVGSGWLADNTTFRAGLTGFAPASAYHGLIERSTWLPNEDVANAFRAYATYDRPLKLASPDVADGWRRFWEPGEEVTVVVDDTAFAGWTRLEFYDGARRVGLVTAGPPQLALRGLTPGYHPITVLGTGARGEQRCADPTLVCVRAPLAQPPDTPSAADPLAELKRPASPLSAMAFSADGLQMVCGLEDGDLVCRQPRGDGPTRGRQAHHHAVSDIALSPDGASFATASLDGTTIVWDLETLEPQRTLTDPGGWVAAVAYGPDGQTLATGGNDRSVRLWSVADGSLLRTFEAAPDAIGGLAFSPDGQTLASGGLDKTVTLWDVASGTAKTLLKGHDSWVTDLAWSRDGQTLASASLDQTIIVWDLASGQPRLRLRGHTGPVLGIALRPDGRTLASASYDGTVRLWNTADGQLRQAVELVNRRPTCLAYDGDGGAIAIGCDDGWDTVWDPDGGPGLDTSLRQYDGPTGTLDR